MEAEGLTCVDGRSSLPTLSLPANQPGHSQSSGPLIGGKADQVIS